MDKIFKRKNAIRNMCKMRFVILKTCPYCGSWNIHDSKRNEHHVWKGIPNKFIKEFNSFSRHIKECETCGTLFKPMVPNNEFLKELYKNHYVEQPAGLLRFQNNFLLDEFKSSVLEVGGGIVGVEKICKGDYYNLDPNSQSMPDKLSNWNVETLNDDNVKYLKTLKIENIVSCDVIEHLLQPCLLFEIAAKILKTKGRFYLHVGQFHEELHELIHIQVLHLTSASLKTIKYMAEKYGFKIIEGETKHKSSFVLERL
jgi:hypothetical protein